jgi:hypothetical protein
MEHTFLALSYLFGQIFYIIKSAIVGHITTIAVNKSTELNRHTYLNLIQLSMINHTNKKPAPFESGYIPKDKPTQPPAAPLGATVGHWRVIIVCSIFIILFTNIYSNVSYFLQMSTIILYF